MEHLLLKAANTATTDSGEFTAIAAAYSVDRVKDRIIPGAFKNTIVRWQASGKMIPLHWNHEGDAQSIIGSIDPKSMRETDAGLYVEGKVDLADSDVAREAWRSMKNGAMSLSFGYIVNKARKASGGVTELLDIDLFEISIVPAPANDDTKVLSLKSIQDDLLAVQQRLLELGESDRLQFQETMKLVLGLVPEQEKAEETDKEPPVVRSVDPLRKQAESTALEFASDGLSLRKPPRKVTQPRPEPELSLVALKRRMRDELLIHLSGESP